MDDNQDNSSQDSAETGENQSAADSSSPSYVTSDQLDAFSKDLMGNMRKTLAGMLKTQQQPEQRKAPPPQQAQQQDYKELLAAERATDRLLQRHGLTERQSDMARQLLEVNKPEDANAFIASFAKDVGAVTPGSSTPKPEPTKAAPNPSPTSDRGAPGMTASLESDDVPVWKWSEEKVAKFIQEKGYREFANVMKQRLPKDLQGVRFHIPRS